MTYLYLYNSGAQATVGFTGNTTKYTFLICVFSQYLLTIRQINSKILPDICIYVKESSGTPAVFCGGNTENKPLRLSIVQRSYGESVRHHKRQNNLNP